MKRLRKPSPALMISLIALFVALGGTTYAATSLPSNSVGTPQLKNGAVTKKKIARKTIKALRGNTGPQGPQGPQGLQGSKGDKGAQGLPGANGATNVVIRPGPQAFELPNQHFVSGAFCHTGEVATGGGYIFPTADPAAADDIVQISRPDPAAGAPTDGSVPTLWAAQIYDVNADDSSSESLQAYVICASP
jgi:hypothetical protein